MQSGASESELKWKDKGIWKKCVYFQVAPFKIPSNLKLCVSLKAFECVSFLINIVCIG